jgi:very-short-patch-repair endonuclease
MTPAEARLWNGLRGWKLGRFRRQHAVGEFILDFYCAPTRLCVEVDGGVHEEPGQKAKDEVRSKVLAAFGIRVLRFSNEEVLRDTPLVLRRIQWVLAAPRPPVSPLPDLGEGGEPQRAG